jgi:hypothetical protein
VSLRRKLGLMSGAGITPVLDHDLALWAAAVVANGGTVSAARYAIVGRFILAEKAAGLWTLTDDYLGLWAENAIQALTSLKQRRLATAVNSPTFTADRNYAFGTPKYINTGFIPGTHAVAMSVSSVHHEVYERTNVNGNSPMGVITSGPNQINTQTRSSGNAIVSVMGGNATYTLPATTSVGLTQSGRSGATTSDNYAAKNGVDMTRTVTYSSLGTFLPTHSTYIGGVNNAGVLSQAKAASVGYVSFGGKLNGTQRAARYANVLAWATAVGANV